MPAFSPDQLTTLKKALQSVASTGYRLQPPGIAATAAETGLTQEQVRLWVKDVFVYYNTKERFERFLSGKRVSCDTTRAALCLGDFPH